MAWQQNIPQSNNKLRISQGDLLGNFQALNTFMDINHFLPGSGDVGKHKMSTYVVQAPAPAFAAGEVGLYNFLNPTLNNNQLYVALNDGTRIPMTAANRANDGWSYLPSGLLIKWGHSNGNGFTNINFPAGANIPAFTQIYNMQITTGYNNVNDGDGFVRLNDYNLVSFRVYCSARTTVTNKAVSFEYFAIGI